ncbi:hypothetical protein Barb4_02726 [Bacteroidales bacterium Barb4]|nr:hypothetical protein Barb4_02726 [Bacteroidales bacterium Barb4]
MVMLDEFTRTRQKVPFSHDEQGEFYTFICCWSNVNGDGPWSNAITVVIN